MKLAPSWVPESLSVMDAFDAMISSRPYRKGLGIPEAIQRLQAGSGTQFDPDVTRHFVAIATDEAAGRVQEFAKFKGFTSS